MSQQPRHRPFVPETIQMREFTLRALLLGLVLTVILGAANAYLGLRAGITIAATYPAAVVGMAVLRFFNGSVLEENITRTAGSIGESVAAGAIFTLPAFLISGAWPSFEPKDAYWKSTALMVVGSILGVLFVSLVRRVMVEDPDLPFPESVAASEIHKAGRRGAEAAKFLFYNIALGALIEFLGAIQAFRAGQGFLYSRRASSARAWCGWASEPNARRRRRNVRVRPHRESGLHRSRLHHRPGTGGAAILRRRAGLGSHGSAAGLLSGTAIARASCRPAQRTPPGRASMGSVWRNIVRPIAVGGMMVGAAYTLFRMRKGLFDGLKPRDYRPPDHLRSGQQADPHRAVHECRRRSSPDRPDVRLHDRTVHLSPGTCSPAL